MPRVEWPFFDLHRACAQAPNRCINDFIQTVSLHVHITTRSVEWFNLRKGIVIDYVLEFETPSRLTRNSPTSGRRSRQMMANIRQSVSLKRGTAHSGGAK